MSAVTLAHLSCRNFSVHISINLCRYTTKIQEFSGCFKEVTISCKSKIFLVPFHKLTKNLNKISAVASDHGVFISNIVQDQPCFKIDQSNLMYIVEMRSLDQLVKLGGVPGIADSLNSDLHRGLDSDDNEDILRRREAFGTNTYNRLPGKNFSHFVPEAFDDPVLDVILACAMLVLGLDIQGNGPVEGLYDCGSIFAAVLFVVSISATTNFRRNEKLYENFMFSDNIQVEVMRSGKRMDIPASEVAVGDVVCLKTGDQVPADGLFIEGQALRVDESKLSTFGNVHDHDMKDEKNPFLFSGSNVTDGCARMLVTSVGMKTTRGKMLRSINSDSIDQHSPFQDRTTRLISSVGKVGSGAAFLVFVMNSIQKKRNYNLERRKKKLKELAVVFTASSSVASSICTNVFGVGKYISKLLKVDQQQMSNDNSSYPPKPLLIATPSEAGVFPVLLFIHGYLLYNSFYSQLVQHIASHGFIVIAPQLYRMAGPDATEEINATAEIANWLSEGIQNLLPSKVQPNLAKLALAALLAGHSRGGKVAFAVALGKAVTSLKFSALIGIDPVDGPEKGKQMPPILTYNPHSFDLNMAVSIIGSGLGETRSNFLFPPSTPKGVNHKDFYNECKKPACYFVAKDYGHLDMLDDDTSGIRGKATYCVCKKGESRDPMRRFVGGIMVAFMRTYLEGNSRDLLAIKDGCLRAPVELQNVDFLV